MFLIVFQNRSTCPSEFPVSFIPFYQESNGTAAFAFIAANAFEFLTASAEKVGEENIGLQIR